MSRITITKLAVEKIKNDAKFRQLQESSPEAAAPLLSYYQRCFSTLKDGTIIEHGDGFMLNFVDPTNLKETSDIAYQAITTSNGTEVTVGGPRDIMSDSFGIDWSNNKFSLERE